MQSCTKLTEVAELSTSAVKDHLVEPSIRWKIHWRHPFVSLSYWFIAKVLENKTYIADAFSMHDCLVWTPHPKKKHTKTCHRNSSQLLGSNYKYRSLFPLWALTHVHATQPVLFLNLHLARQTFVYFCLFICITLWFTLAPVSPTFPSQRGHLSRSPLSLSHFPAFAHTAAAHRGHRVTSCLDLSAMCALSHMYFACWSFSKLFFIVQMI